MHSINTKTQYPGQGFNLPCPSASPLDHADRFCFSSSLRAHASVMISTGRTVLHHVSLSHQTPCYTISHSHTRSLYHSTSHSRTRPRTDVRLLQSHKHAVWLFDSLRMQSAHSTSHSTAELTTAVPNEKTLSPQYDSNPSINNTLKAIHSPGEFHRLLVLSCRWQQL